MLEVLALLCRNAKLTLSTTTAALYRRIEAAGDAPPTVLQDEADAVFGKTANPQAEDLRALFNSGYKRGATVDRCEGDAKNMKVREFKVFAPVALAGLAGKMSATITDRGITLHMRRRAPDEDVAEFRERDAAKTAKPLRDQIEVWTAANYDQLAAARPKMPEGVRDRPAEVWEALIAIADIAGGDWPERSRAACRHFVVNADPVALSLGLRLLRDVHTVFGDLDRCSRRHRFRVDPRSRIGMARPIWQATRPTPPSKGTQALRHRVARGPHCHLASQGVRRRHRYRAQRRHGAATCLPVVSATSATSATMRSIRRGRVADRTRTRQARHERDNRNRL